nr:luciferase family protein [Actinomadura barringtoniae]
MSIGRNHGGVAAHGNGSISLAGRIVDRLNSWPGVAKVRADCGMGVALTAGGSQIMHLHTDDEAELRLSRPVIERLGGVLTESGRVRIKPDSEWIAVRLDTDSDMALVVSLASVAIKASTAADIAPHSYAPCGAARAAPEGTLRRLTTAIRGSRDR